MSAKNPSKLGKNVQLVEYNKWRDSFIGTKRNTIISEDGNCEGYIDLLGENGHFNKYFFVLDALEMKLKCYHENPKKSPSMLTSVKVLVDIKYISKVSKCTKSKYPFSFEIHTPSKKYLLSTKNSTDMTYWVTALTKAATNPTQTVEDNLVQRSASLSLEEQSFKTSIIGGVVVKTPVCTTVRTNSLDQKCIDNQKNKSNSAVSSLGLKNTMEGWCWKQGAVMKNWKRRYFRLNTIKLSYYETDKVLEPIRSIPSANILNVRIINRFCGRDNMVEVETPSRKFYMNPDDGHDPMSWKEELEKIMVQNGNFLPHTKSV